MSRSKMIVALLDSKMLITCWYFFIFSLSTKIPLPSTVLPFYLCSGGQLELEGGKRPPSALALLNPTG